MESEGKSIDNQFIVQNQTKYTVRDSIKASYACIYGKKKVEIWLGVTDASHTHSQTTEDRATQLV